MFSGPMFAANLRNGIETGTSFFKKAIKVTPVQHMSQGMLQFYAGFYFWPEAQQTKIIFLNSLSINLYQYVLPVVLYHRLVKTLRENYFTDSPLLQDYIIPAVDIGLTVTLLSRLFVRRFIDNTFIALSLPRAINNDLAVFRPKLLAEKITPAIMALVAELGISLRSNYQSTLQNFLTSYFTLHTMNAESFLALKKPLRKMTNETLADLPLEQTQEKFELLQTALKMLVIEFANAFNLKKTNHELLIKDNIPLRNFASQLKKLRTEVQPFLNISYHPPCECYLEKKLHADISTYVYFQGHVLMSHTPALFHNRKFMDDSTYLWLVAPVFVLQRLIYGQSFNETKISAEKHCTRHRYKEFMRSKMHSIGVGLAYYLSSMMLIYTLDVVLNYDKKSRISGLEFFLLNDAFANLAIHFASISFMSYNMPLPGKVLKPHDIFLASRYLIQMVSGVFLWLFEESEPDAVVETGLEPEEEKVPEQESEDEEEGVKIEKPLEMAKLNEGLIPWMKNGFSSKPVIEKPEEGLIPWLKNGFRSKPFRFLMNYCLTGTEFLPVLNSQEDTLEVFLKIPAVQQCLSLYQKDIQDRAMDFSGWNATANNWLVDKLVVTPLLFFYPAIKLPLKILKDKDIDRVLSRIAMLEPVIIEPVDVPQVVTAQKTLPIVAVEETIAEILPTATVPNQITVEQDSDDDRETFDFVPDGSAVSRNSESLLRRNSIWVMHGLTRKMKVVGGQMVSGAAFRK